MFKRILLLFICMSGISGVSGYGYEIHPNAGETAAAFLKISPGGRGVAMGEAQVSIGSDVYGMWWNPASLARIRRRTAAVSYNRWFQQMGKSFAGIAFPLYKNECLGFMFDSLIIDNTIERRSGTDEADPYYPVTDSEGSFGAYDIMAAGSYARKLGGNLYGGISVKWLRQVIDDEGASAVSTDIGFQYDGLSIAGKNLDLGISLRNFGTAVKFKKDSYNLPLDILAGAGVNVTDRLLALLELQQQVDDYMKVHAGAEYRLWNRLFLRAGYIYRITGNPLGNETGFRGGLGFGTGDFIFDYSYAPYGFLGESHRVSIQVMFGKVAKKRHRAIVNKRETAASASLAETEVPDYIKMAITPLSISPSSILWQVSWSKQKGMVKKIKCVTKQQDIGNINFVVNEYTEVPSGYPGRERFISGIKIDTGLMPALVEKMEIEVDSAKKIKIVTGTDTITAEKCSNGRYCFSLRGLTRDFYIVEDE